MQAARSVANAGVQTNAPNRAEIERLRREMAAYEEQARQAAQNAQTLQGTVRNLETQRDAVQAEAAQHAAAIERLNDQLQRLYREGAAVNAIELRAGADELQVAANELRVAADEIGHQRTRHAAAIAQLNEQLQQVEAARRVNQEAGATRNANGARQLQEAVNSQRMQHAAEVARLTRQLESVRTVLQRTREEGAARNAKGVQQLEAAASELQNQRAQHATAVAQLDVERLKAARQANRQQQLQAAADELRNQLAQHAAAVTQLNQQLADTQAARRENANRAKQAANSALRNERVEVRRLTNQLVAVQAARQRNLEANAAGHANRAAQLKAAANALQNQRARHNAEVGRLEEQLAGVQVARQANQQSALRNQQALAAGNANRTQQLVDTVQHIQGQLAAVRARETQQDAEVAGLNGQLALAEAALQQSQVDGAVARVAVRLLRSVNQTQRAAIRLALTENEAMQARQDALRLEADETMRAMQGAHGQELQALRQRMDRLQQQQVANVAELNAAVQVANAGVNAPAARIVANAAVQTAREVANAGVNQLRNRPRRNTVLATVTVGALSLITRPEILRGLGWLAVGLSAPRLARTKVEKQTEYVTKTSNIPKMAIIGKSYGVKRAAEAGFPLDMKIKDMLRQPMPRQLQFQQGQLPAVEGILQNSTRRLNATMAGLQALQNRAMGLKETLGVLALANRTPRPLPTPAQIEAAFPRLVEQLVPAGGGMMNLFPGAATAMAAFLTFGQELTSGSQSQQGQLAGTAMETAVQEHLQLVKAGDERVLNMTGRDFIGNITYQAAELMAVLFNGTKRMEEVMIGSEVVNSPYVWCVVGAMLLVIAAGIMAQLNGLRIPRMVVEVLHLVRQAGEALARRVARASAGNGNNNRNATRNANGNEQFNVQPPARNAPAAVRRRAPLQGRWEVPKVRLPRQQGMRLRNGRVIPMDTR